MADEQVNDQTALSTTASGDQLAIEDASANFELKKITLTDFFNDVPVSIMIGDDANANQTIGLTINQGANDDEAFTLKSSDVSHAMTDVTEADSYGFVAKYSNTEGGFDIRGFNEGSGHALRMVGAWTSDDTTKGASSLGAIELRSEKDDGANGTGAIGTDGNLVTIANAGTTRFIFDAEGSLHSDVGTTTFQGHDDLGLLEAFESALHPAEHGAADETLLQELKDLGIVQEHRGHEQSNERLDQGRNRIFTNQTKLQMLAVGAIRQLKERVEALENA